MNFETLDQTLRAIERECVPTFAMRFGVLVTGAIPTEGSEFGCCDEAAGGGGTVGPQGPQGPQGDPGADGADGADGEAFGPEYHPDRLPTSGMVAALSDEFDGTSVASWIWGNQDAATDTIELDTAFMDSGDAEATGTDGPNGRYLADPAANFQSDFMVAVKMSPLCRTAFNGAGPLVMVGGSGNPITAPTTLYGGYIYADAGLDPTLTFGKKTGYTGAYSLAGSEADAQLHEVSKWTTEPIYLAMIYVASSKALNFYYSQDGMTWINHGGTAATLAAHPSFVGRVVDSNGTGSVARARFHWFRFFTDSTRWASLTSIKVGEFP